MTLTSDYVGGSYKTTILKLLTLGSSIRRKQLQNLVAHLGAVTNAASFKLPENKQQLLVRQTKSLEHITDF